MEEVLQQIRDNTAPKQSFQIMVSGKGSRITTRFNPSIQLNPSKTYEMALMDLDTYYSFPNIDATNNNFRYSPDNGVTWEEIDIPEGCYELVSINKYVQTIMKIRKDDAAARSNNVPSDDKTDIVIKANNNTLTTTLRISEGYLVDFTPNNSIRTVLGFDSGRYTPGFHESQNIVNILSISSILVTSDIIGSSYINGNTGNVIYSFFPDVGPGFKIVEKPTNLVYLPVILSTISSMSITLTDQNGKLLNVRGEDVSLRFHIREG